MSTRSRHYWWLYLAAGAILCGLYLFKAPFRGSGPVINGLGLYGVIGVVGGIRIHKPKAALAWWFMAGGLLLFFLGDVYTYSYNLLFHADVPFPSPGDAMYIAVYPVLMIGLLLLVRRRNQRAADGPGVIDAVIMSVGLSLVSFLFLIAPDIHDGTMSLIQKLVSIAYPTGDLILLAAAVRLAVDAGKRRPSFYLLIASIVTLLLTDFVYGILELKGAYNHQLWLDAGWIFFYLLWGAAALHPSMVELSDAETGREPRLTGVRLVLLAGATLIAPVLELTRTIPGHNWDAVVLIGTSMGLFTLVIGRMAGLVRQRETAAARERALSAAGGLLVGATDRNEIVIAALQAVVELGGDQVDARLCRITGENVRVLAIDERGGLVEWTVAGDVAALVQESDMRGVAMLPAYARQQLRMPIGEDPVLGLELRQGDASDSLLMFVVAGAPCGDADTRYAMRTLAHQVAMALGSAVLSEEVHRQASEARFSTLVANATDLITVLRADNTIAYQSPSIERVLGYTADEVIGSSFESLLHPEEQGRLLRRLSEGVGAGRPEVIECLLRAKDGELRYFEILHSNLLDDEAVRGIVLNGRDVSERKEFEEQLAHQAFHDPVTHLANRALFNERVRHAVARALREGIGMSVVFVDLDDFKTVNDSLGHAAGDQVLIEVAKRISGSIRAADTAARFGGDEFAILLEDVDDLQHAAETAERILEALARPLQLDHNDIVIRASLGISVAEPGNPADADELIRNADAAMYIAKGEGKGGYRVFEPAMHEQVVARLELRADLQRALERDEFQLHYQPLVRLRDGAVTSVEALLRWNHPTRGLIPPFDFIPFAEESGLIVPIGRWVLREGCRQAKLFRDETSAAFKPGIGINLSVKQLFQSDIVGDVRAALADAGLEASALTLEITESVMMTDIDLAVSRLQELRDLGVRLAMDDFGTGYSSLSYLSKFPLDILKMDRSLLAAGASPVTSGLASAVLGLGETFDLEVVAEGIEYPEQSATLRELGCETGQGFYFARPMIPGDLLAYLDERAGEVDGSTVPAASS
jgi:diguanylate cyclase (GGDEF)-like protein/PAS domain S-box-containing protein